MTDPACDLLGIPTSLHTLGRPANAIEPGEEVYRFFIQGVEEDLTLAISFDRRRSSVNRVKYCADPSDALWYDEVVPDENDPNQKRGRREGYGVVRFRADLFDGKLWPVQGGTDTFRVGIVHEPKRCNFAHCSIVVWKNDEEVQTIKPPSVKLRIRESLQGKVFFALPLERAGGVMPLKGEPRRRD